MGGWIWCKYCVQMHVNGKVTPAETILGTRVRGDKREWWTGWIQVWYILYITRTFVTATMYSPSTTIKKNEYLKNSKNIKPLDLWFDSSTTTNMLENSVVESHYTCSYWNYSFNKIQQPPTYISTARMSCSFFLINSNCLTCFQ
jgi:hypothetical protein